MTPSLRQVAVPASSPASQLVWVQQPIDGNAGSALYPAPTVVLEDPTGCVVQTDASQVKLSITAGTGTPGATLNNCLANLGSGETSFLNCTISTIGTGYTLTATDPTDHLTSVPSVPFNIAAGVPAKLAWSTQPGNGLGGQALTPQPVVQIEDASGNPIAGDSTTVTLAIGTNPSSGTLSGCTGTSNGNGQVTFSGCKIDKAGTGYTLTATDAADNLTTPSVSNPFNVAVGPAAQLSFTTSPGTTVAGDKFGTQPVVTIQDLGGNTVTANTSAVSLAIGTNPGGGTLSGCTGTTTAGVATFSSCSISKPGNGYTLVASDGTLAPATSTPFNIVTPALTSFSVTSSTNNPTAGTPFNVTITALDQSGFTFPGFTGAQAIAFSGPASSPNGTAPLYPPTVNFSTGTGTASVKLYDAQTTQITATQGAVTGTSGNITVSGLTTTAGFSLSNPGTVSSGTPFSETVKAIDQYGNTTSGYRGTVHFTSSDGQAVLPGNYTFTAGDAGTHTFTNGVTLKTQGTQSITATDTGNGTITGTVSGITVTVGPTSQLVVSGYPNPTTAGTAHNVTVTAEDAAGNVTSAYTGTVHFTSSDGQAVLPGDYTFTAGDAGAHTFTNGVTLKTAGTQSITATDTVTGTITGTQSVSVLSNSATTRSSRATRTRPRPGRRTTSRSRPTTPSATRPPATGARSTSPAATA